MKISSHIDASGPFFTKSVEGTLAENVMAMMEGLAREGEADLRQQFAQGESARAELSFGGRVSEHVKGRVRSLTDAPWHRWAVISPERTGAAKSSVALYAAASEIESQIHAVRHTTYALRRSKAAQVAELTRGLE